MLQRKPREQALETDAHLPLWIEDRAVQGAECPHDLRMKQHWSEGEIVEIASLVAYFGFMNRFNDTMGRSRTSPPSWPRNTLRSTAGRSESTSEQT